MKHVKSVVLPGNLEWLADLDVALSHLFLHYKLNKEGSVVTDYVTTWPGTPNKVKQP